MLCVFCTEDLIINIAIDVIHFRGVEYISEDVSFIALYLPSGVFFLCKKNHVTKPETSGRSVCGLMSTETANLQETVSTVCGVSLHL